LTTRDGQIRTIAWFSDPDQALEAVGLREADPKKGAA
jgi:hypothetical protein